MNRKIVYVVSSRTVTGINEREKNLLLLRGYFDKMVLICRGDNLFSEEVWEIRHDTNPTGVLRKLGLHSLKKAVDRWLFFPSVNILFVNAIYRKIKKQIQTDIKKGNEVSLITCLPPHDLCLLGIKLKHHCPTMRWICDWQDLWSYDEYYLERVPKLFRNKLLRMEQQAFNRCDMNVTTNPYAKSVLIEQYGVPEKRCMSIYHPFNESDIADGPDVDKLSYARNDSKRSLRIIFLGALFKPPKVPGDKVLEAMRFVRARGIDAELHVYGSYPPVEDVAIEWAKEGGVLFKGYLEREEIVSRIRACDMLLLILAELPNCRAIMNIKLPSYLLAERPICAIVPEHSAVAEIITKTGSGYVIPAAEDWGEGLYTLFDNYLSGVSVPTRNKEAIQHFSWRNLSAQWLDII